mmetsp:Transcript_30905/g.68436  ORF Transcript_30905/g.68436 Transcript_30905/m.68436 type:complete len:647 (+) Transcript_30905:67-2007(+)|eukprot:CAMPEP_0202902734 /NCGR_PEP_ID=MMETSP1392-20130828/17023_1 /ASSEMBLY_ACC=CAM_ASM_000868 /TAXON_ID=225041 /ORGANISM="Chlamydomonas chlamydogama, Strain SAG 11-48b" /LENGTH=646 /DNA_ID=CAMNT_0049589541 /DNA_START=69 /DNA_END=2009 /DNA_ORIENTATION=+
MAKWLPSLGAIKLPTVKATTVVALAVPVAAIYVGHKALQRLQYIGKNEQVLVKKLTEKIVINGPGLYFPDPFTTLSYVKRKGINLTAMQYVLVEDEQTGETRVVSGPQLLFLGPYETAQSPKNKTVLGATEAITVTNKVTGEVKLVKGPTTFVPGPLEEVSERVEPITLTKTEYIRLKDELTGRVWVERGPALLFLDPHITAQGAKATAWSLEPHQYIRLQDTLTGEIRVERGEKLVFPSAFEVKVDKTSTGVKECIDLQRWEYCVVQDRATGKVRVERGEKLVWLGGTERVMGREKEQAVKVDSENAVLVLNQATGKQRLVEEPQLFFPSEDEVVVEVRRRIKLADNEAIVLKDAEGKYHYRYGDPKKNKNDAARSFFLPPYWEVVTLMWSRGRRRERRDLAITTFDMRAQYMSFEFNCRTSDNVEMILEGTFFWEVVDLPAMMQYTGDAPGDVCNHARSCFIQLVSKVTLQTFMDTFNEIAHAAHSNDDTFYSQRGIKIHSLEVTRYQCADASTSAILEAIIQETTNRMNRLSCQESENEVALAKLRGAVEQERATSEVLTIQHEHELASARATGVAEAERCVAFLEAMNKSGAVGRDDKDLAEEFWRVLRRNEALATVATGSAHVYFTPQDAHLTIENRPSAA